MLKTYYFKNKLLVGLMFLLFTGFAATSFAQSARTVTGTVTDANSEPLPGATVQIKGTNTGASSDDAGKYSINVPAGKAVLTFSMLGFASQEIELGSKTLINVTMKEDAEQIEEVVVVGYGTQKRVTLTGSVVAIDNKEMVTTKSSNIQNSLTGKMAGVKVVQGSSEPGAFDETQFSIRGMGKPLFIIDGVPRENMTRLDPNEVESISILKDASAAIYGTRAANGVVLITTKQGEKNTKFRFDYTGYIGIERFMNEVQALDAIGYMALSNEQNFNRGNTNIPYGRSNFEAYNNGVRVSSDWVNEFINPSPLETQHSLAASGGTNKVGYFINFGYTSQQGRWKSNISKYHRFNLRSNVNAELMDGFMARVKINLMQDNRHQQPRESWRIFDNTWELYPIDPIYLPDPVTGEPSTDYPYYNQTTFHPGIYTSTGVGFDDYFQRLVQTNLSLEWAVPGVEGLKVSGMYSYDFRLDDTKRVVRKTKLYDYQYKEIGGGNGFINRKNLMKTNSLFQFQANYDKTLFGKHNISAMVLYEESIRESDNYWLERVMVLNSVDEIFAGSKDNIQGTQEPNDRYTFVNKGLVGRLNYDYGSKYMATFSFRYDGSSKFGPGHQWGFFPVGTVGWRVSEESFIKNSATLKFIKNLKFRASYGVMGDDSAADYQFLSGYQYPYLNENNNPQFNGGNWVMDGSVITPLKPMGVANKIITWFTAKTANIGLDFDLWNGLFGGAFEIFQRDRDGMLDRRTITLPDQGGMSLPQENINSDRTRGVEITLTHRNTIKKEFKYNASAYFALDRTMQIYKEREEFFGQWNKWREKGESGDDKNNESGRWKDLVWGWEHTGQFQSLEEVRNNDVIYDKHGNINLLPGDIVYEDWNGDGIIDDNDKHPISTKHTVLSFGLTLGAEWRGFDFSATIQGTGFNRRRLGDVSANFEQPLRADASGLAAFTDRWHRADEFKPTVEQEWIPGYYPSMYTGIVARDFITKPSTFWILDASYVRLKTVELGYTIPKKLSQKIKLDRARIFFNGYNLFTLSHIKLTDPEQSNRYPLNKTFNLGLNLSF